jgi:pimeloyl-ACP methyl ester carboxylesterase
MIERWVRIDGRDVRYIETGAGPVVIFAAGLGISADFYRPNMAALANAGFRAIAPDLPGFGQTRCRVLGSSIAQLADHLAQFADALDIAPASWIGHSIGAQAVVHLAARRPDLARAAVLAGPTGGYGRRLLRQAGAIAVAAFREPWRLTKAVLHDYVRLSPLNYIGTWVKAGRHDPLQHAPRVACPVLILVGSKDHVPHRDFIAHLLHKLPDAELRRVIGGQHGLPVDAADAFNRAVINFLRARERENA